MSRTPSMLIEEFTATATGRYECKICLKTFTRTGGLKQHLSSHSKQKSSSSKNLSCSSKKKQKNAVTEERMDSTSSKITPEGAVMSTSSFTMTNPFVKICSGVESRQCDINSSKVMLEELASRPVIDMISCQLKSSTEKWDDTSVPVTAGGEISSFSGRYECSLCLQTFSRGEGLKKHMLGHRNGNVSSEITMPSKKQKLVTKLGQKKVIACKEELNNSRLLSKAVELVLGSYKQNESGRFICMLCPKTFSRKSGLQQHMLCHSNIKPFCCEICGKKFLRKYSLDIHIRAHVQEKPYECKICGKKFVTKGQLSTHTRTHTKEKRYHCNICLQKFSQKEHMKDHKLSHTNERERFKCPICPATFTRKYTVQLHIRGCHSSIPSFGCTVCGKFFKRKEYLSVHLKTHFKENKFCCDYCPKRFSVKSSLRVHMRRHLQEKPFKCWVCEMAFVEKGDLTRHLRIHDNVKPYSCKFCDKAFTQIGNLKRHRLVHTGEKPYQCLICGEAFRQKAHRARHMRAHGWSSATTNVGHVYHVSDSVGAGPKRGASACPNNDSKIGYEEPPPKTVLGLNATDIPLDDGWKVKVEQLVNSYEQDGTEVPCFSQDSRWTQNGPFE